MLKYRILVIVYLFSIAASSIANFFGVDVQNFYRVPFLNVRWIDLAILFVVASFFFTFISGYSKFRKKNSLIPLCIIYLFFEFIQLIKSWGLTDTQAQVSLFICTLNFFILIDLSTFKIKTEEIIKFLRSLSLWGAVVVIITNIYLVYSFISGNVIFTDLNIRAAIDVIGARETVSNDVLISFVYAFSLYFIQHEKALYKKLIYIAATFSIYLSLVIEFHRGDLVMVILLTIIYVIFFSKKPAQIFIKMLGMAMLMGVCYFMFANILSEKGYDPVKKITETIKFSVDVNDPDWDKGRSISRDYAIAAWQNHFWFGVGYDNLSNYGLPDNMATAHNFILTSLFHRGIIGTGLYLIVLLILFCNSIKLFRYLKRQKKPENDWIKLLVIASFFWLIPFWNQEVAWEKYSLSIEFLYLGLLTNLYLQETLQRPKLKIPFTMTIG